MNQSLISYLRANIGKPITSDIAADICILADQLPTLVHSGVIEQIEPMHYQGATFAVEKIEKIADEVKPLHRAHWNETESHRHGIDLNPDYNTFIRYERAGRYILFTLRREGKLVGNCAMYLNESTHTKTLIATEDTLYILNRSRNGRTAKMFISYCENALRRLGVREISVTVKTINKAARFFAFMGYKHVENGLTKVLEEENVRT